MSRPPSSLLLAFEGFEKDLSDELRRSGAAIVEVRDRLVLAHGVTKRPVWAQASGRDVQTISIASISEAARVLKSMGRRWACASQTMHRRSELIQEQTYRVRVPELDFLQTPPTETWGIWALWDPNTMLASSQSDDVFPLGEVRFKESAEPPSRAYLKLWELFTVHGVRPSAGARTVDLGSAPGGWTHVLAEQLGCHVLAVDKAPLAEKLAQNPLVKSLKKDAFKLTPAEAGPMDWVFSDLICYPPRLWDLVQEWRAAGVRNFACTLKFQGETDFDSLERFAAVPGSRVVHLHANKHEVTWFGTNLPQP